MYMYICMSMYMLMYICLSIRVYLCMYVSMYKKPSTMMTQNSDFVSFT